MAKTIKPKWFYPAQEVSKKWLQENSEDYSCNWQTVTKDIVCECFLLLQGSTNGTKTVLFVYYKNSKNVMLFDGNTSFGRKF